MSDISDLLVELAEVGVDELDYVNIYMRLRANGEIVELMPRRGGDTVDVLSIKSREIHGYAQDDTNSARWFGRATS